MLVVKFKATETLLGRSFIGRSLSYKSLANYPLQGDVPNRVYYGKEVSYDHLKVFGCKAFVHIPQDERSKLDSKTRQCIFLSYGGDQFSYKLFDPIARKFVRSSDVVFVEDQTIDDIVKRKKKVLESILVGIPPQR
jgi:hypothetical protein